MTHWMNFTFVIIVQLLVFIVVAYSKKKHADIAPILIKSLPIGLVFGVIFDLVFAGYLGIFEYTFGFDWVFIIINGILSYGIMAATVWLFYNCSFFKFYFLSICIGLTYELANYFFPVWSWQFNENVIVQQFILIFAAYFGLATLLSGMIQISSKTKFKFLTMK